MTDQGALPAPPVASTVKETAVADVQLNDDGAPSQVNGYRVLKQLGEGTTSKVYHCQDESGRDYALKILNKSFLNRKREYKKVDGKMVFSNAFQKVQKEVAIMKKLSHDNLVKLHEIIDSPADDKMVLVLELITGGQVMKWEEKGFRYRCQRTTTGVMDHDDVRRCMRDVIDALAYLHQNFICHRDIKPENILLADQDAYKLADFGVAHMIDDSADKKTLRNTEGTYHFLAPECTTGEEYDPYKVDVWALGVTMFTMLFGTLPFGTTAASLTDVMDSIRVDPLVIDTDAISGDCEHVLRAMMTKDPTERIALEHLKQLAWFQSDTEASANSERVEPTRVEVTREEIEAAFTPVNNFILMVRIKMKMAGRLARARNSIDLAKCQAAAPPVNGHHTTLGGPLMRTAHEPLPPITDPVPENDTSAATCTSSASLVPSPSSSPGKAAVAMLSRRLSWKSAPCDGISPGEDGATSPLKGASLKATTTRVSRRKSLLMQDLIVEEPPAADETAIERPSHGISPVNDSPTKDALSTTGSTRSSKRDSSLTDEVVVKEPSREHEASVGRVCDGIFTGDGCPTESESSRTSSTRLSKHRSSLVNELVVEEPLAANEATVASGSRLKVRGESEVDVAAVDETSLKPRASPSRGANLHLTGDTKLPRLDITGSASNSPCVSPASTPIRRQLTPRCSRDNVAKGWDEANDDLSATKKSPTDTRHRSPKLHQGTVHPAPEKSVGESPSGIASHKSSSPSKKKTQDEAKVAISNIVHRSNGATTSPRAGPVKEPSMMLQRRRSSSAYSVPLTIDTADQESYSTRTGQNADAALPRLRLSTSNGEETNHAPDRSSTLMSSSHIAHPRTPDSSDTTNDGASTGPPPDNHDGDNIASNDRVVIDRDGAGSPRASRTRRFRDSPLAKCLPCPNDSGLFLVDPSTHRISMYTDEEHVGIDASSERKSPVKDTVEKTSPKSFGLFRKTSSNNVAPLELIPNAGIGGENGCAENQSLTKQQRRPRGDDETHLVPASPRLHAPAMINGLDATSEGSPDSETGSLSAHKALSPRKSVLQSHESIRLLVLRRSESLKALLSGKKAHALEGTDNSLQRYPALALVPTKGPSAATVSGAISPRKSRTGSITSASCLVQ